MRSGVETPGEDATPNKLPVRSKGEEDAVKDIPKSTPRATTRKGPANKDESSRPSSKKKSTFVVESKTDSTPSKSNGKQDQTVITGPEQPAPEAEDKIVNDSQASPESGNEAESPEAEPADDSDSDEAPEAVSTSKAAAQVKKSAQAANKAIQEYAS